MVWVHLFLVQEFYEEPAAGFWKRLATAGGCRREDNTILSRSMPMSCSAPTDPTALTPTPRFANHQAIVLLGVVIGLNVSFILKTMNNVVKVF